MSETLTREQYADAVSKKGVRTREFIMKKKLMKAVLGIDIEEVK